ncbi:MAG: DUF488 family protein [Microlunatus sp.]|nr:DUF488 family protein [Microlunatus sp.]
MIRITRVYEPRDDTGGALHVLVDGLWPRAMAEDDERIDEWWKELAPTPMLRTWYSHQADRWDEFSARFQDELSGEDVRPVLEKARKTAADRGLVLLTATKDLSLSHTRILARVIEPGWHPQSD